MEWKDALLKIGIGLLMGFVVIVVIKVAAHNARQADTKRKPGDEE